MKSRVTTKAGDSGTTRTLSGEVLSKSHPVLKATGRLDALRAQTAQLRLFLLEEGEKRAEETAFLYWLLHFLFLMGAQVNDPQNKHPEYRKGEVTADHLHKLENEQARLESGLALPRAFIVSATILVAAHADICATVARDFERSVVALKETEPAFDVAAILAFTNRLSDYFFVLARHLEAGQHEAVDYDVL